MLKIWSHKRNNEAEESQYSEQLSKPLLLIFAGTLEMDKLLFFFFFLIRNRCLPFPHSKHLRVSHLPYRVRPWSLYTLSFQNTPLQIFGQLRVSIYLSRCFWLEPNVCCASKKLKTLQTATFKKKKERKESVLYLLLHHHSSLYWISSVISLCFAHLFTIWWLT